MGYNTVVLIMNDFMHEVMKSPNTLTWAICHPPHSDRDIHLKAWWTQIESVAQEHNEDVRYFRNAIKVMPSYHADDKHILIAGWNDLIRPLYEEYKYDKKNNKMTIKMPSYWTR